MGFKNKITGTFNNGLFKKKPDYKYKCNVFDGLMVFNVTFYFCYLLQLI